MVRLHIDATLVGATALLLVFALSGVHKMGDFGASVDSLLAKAPAWPLPRVSMAAVVVLEVLGPVLVVYSLATGRARRLKALTLTLLVGFTALVTCLFHPFKWRAKHMQNVKFFSNLSLLGGLVVLAAAPRCEPS